MQRSYWDPPLQRSILRYMDFVCEDGRLIDSDGVSISLSDRQRWWFDFDKADKLTVNLRHYANIPLHIEFVIMRGKPNSHLRAFLLETNVPAQLATRPEREIAILMLPEALAYYACELEERPLPGYS